MKNLLLNADQILAGTNRTCRKINDQIKGYLGMDKQKLNVGEKIICMVNNWDVTLDDMGDYYQVKIYYPVYDGSVRATYDFEPDASGNYYLTDGFFWRDVTSAVTWTEHKDYIQGYMIQ